MFRRLLIANRGEIAIRIARAASELGIRTLGIYSHEDRFALHRYKTDESYKVGTPGLPLQGYLDIHLIVKVAKQVSADAIHAGYGFLSENAEFAELCQKAGIVFIGPSVEVLQAFGDKVKARRIAKEAGLAIIPGTMEPLASVAEAKKLADSLGYPVTLKAVSGGGGKGIRMIKSEAELQDAFARAQSEAQSSFGRADIYLEKTVLNPKHIEVQILADRFGNTVHLFERDCSIQRRNQKVVEVAPALGISSSLRGNLQEQAVKLAKSVQYAGIGTVEFLVSGEQAYFLEVNPRVQVEHTVTEMVTGVDLLQASILVAAGAPLSDSRIGISDQASISVRGTAIQCRITTEDPLNSFAPDTGTIIAYRPAAGFGIRLDEGQATSGGVVTPFYDSLLVKVTAWGRDLPGAAAKMYRSLSEFRIRGVKHNISLLKNIVKNPSFLASDFDTHFLERHPEVFKYVTPRDRATKLLRYIAGVTVNDLHGLGSPRRAGDVEVDVAAIPVPNPDLAAFHSTNVRPKNAKEVFDEGGVTGLLEWIKDHKPLLLTDTTMRDAHQSLFATRLRTRDILKVAPFYAEYGHRFFSLEVWGGATFDTAMRFLKEDPWERLAKIREAIPNVLLQMLFRGDNAVGYTNYPHWVIRDFIKETVRSGLDLFRIFDCLNQPDKMQAATEEVKKQGAIAELCVCYTGDLTDPKRTKYTLNYYTKVVKELQRIGADLICIKDMAGLLKPRAAAVLVKALRNEVGLPIHLHTHDTSGAGVAMLLEAANAGCEIVDGAISSMSGLTSQPSLNALIASLAGSPKAPEVPLAVTDELARYWEGVRGMYQAFDPGLRATSTDVYFHEIPGGQFSNLYEQAKKVGLSAHEFHETTKRYREVNDLFGDIIKVTPSSKVVGDLALLLHKQKITGPELLAKKMKLDYPDSVVSFLKGHMGVPYGGFPAEFRELVLGKGAPPPETPAVEENDSFDSVQEGLSKKLGRDVTAREVLSHRLYPKVFAEYLSHCRDFGRVTTELPTPVFFYGMLQGEEMDVDLEPGKTLFISLKGISASNQDGKKTVFFQLNGFNRDIEIDDLSSKVAHEKKPKADSFNESHVPAPMPGKVIDVRAAKGARIKQGDTLFVTESMKMEYAVTARSSGTVAEIHAKVGDMVESGDLLAVVIA